jgi:transcriptional regulator of arginine metabolism
MPTKAKPTNSKANASSESANREKQLLQVFKAMLKEQSFRSQDELAYALAQRGFANVSQSKVSRLLAKVGAVKSRNANNTITYNLPEMLVVPKAKHAIETVALEVKHNNVLIVVKTGIGGAPLIARMLDSMEESVGIIGTLAGDDTVLVIPNDIARIEQISDNIKELLGL